MNQMKQMIAQAQQMQRQLAKAKQELAEAEFETTKGGGVTVTFRGDRTLTNIKIDPALLEPDNAEMLESLITLAVNEILADIQAEEDEINEQVTGQPGGFGF